MSLAIVYSRACTGITAPSVTVETHISGGLPHFSIVGLPETAVKESKERVRSALLNMRFEFPARRITVNLAPADLPKEGGRFDLPIALGILAATSQLPTIQLEQYEFTGELALSGTLRPIQGALPFALATQKAGRTLVVPWQNADEAALVSGINILAAKHLMDVCAHLTKHHLLTAHYVHKPAESNEGETDLQDVRGQPRAKRALEIAAAGGHSLLFIGSPGTGKTMLASRLPSILPQLGEEEAIEIATVASISNAAFTINQWRKRPFRAPHHTASSVALVGGGNPPRPGEISLAHHGVLFLDELPEFNRHVLEALREPLESGTITISRAARQAEFPAKFQLIAAMNPCPCGYLNDPHHQCHCSLEQVHRYRMRISGPLLDRIDMHVEVPPLAQSALIFSGEKGEPSAMVRDRVERAREKQLKRSAKINSALSNKELEQVCVLNNADQDLLATIMQKLQLSARAYHRILRIARTIADLADDDKVLTTHLTEALTYRCLERGGDKHDTKTRIVRCGDHLFSGR